MKVMILGNNWRRRISVLKYDFGDGGTLLGYAVFSIEWMLGI
jgi:hypothetical protein